MKHSPLLEVKNIKKYYNPGLDSETRAVDGVDLKIHNGEFVAIMGQSGSGKSTLMHILGFLDTATEGEYIFENTNVTHYTEDQLADIRNTKVGFVFQSFHLLSRTSALDNVKLPMIYAGIQEKEQTKRATKVLTDVGLQDRLEHHPNELSGGQQQRVSIARALINNPKVIFADEPTGNLDTQSSYEIMAILQALHKKGHTIIMVTHEDDIAQHCTRILTMKDGKLIHDKKNTKRLSAEDQLKDLEKKKTAKSAKGR